MTSGMLAKQVWQDLLPTPGRARDSTRVTLAAVLVCVFMFATSMPFVDFGVYLVFLLSHRDTMLTRLTAVGGVVVAGLSTLLLVGVYMVAWDIAWLRLLLWSVTFFIGFFFMRTFIEPDLFLGPLVILALSTFIFDQVPLPNLLLDQIGWMWAAILMVVAAVLLTDWLVGAPTPRETLSIQVRQVFHLAEEGMKKRAEGEEPVPIDMEEIADANKRAGMLMQVHSLTASQASRSVALLRSVARVENKAAAAGPQARDRAFWTNLADCIALVRQRIREGNKAPLPVAWPASPQDDELARSIAHFRKIAEGLDTGESPGEDGKVEPEPIMAADWKTNPAYVSFALRATLATMGTYIFMSFTAWNGIHTCMVTCVVTALTSEGAQIRKQNLRMAGAVLGALAGVGALLFILPAHQNLLTLLIVLGVLSYVAAWMATGPLRISYAGWQVALAVYYVLLADPHITTNLDPIRDRLIGIFVGILAMRAAFVWFAPQKARLHSAG